eukprot:TRINITY_DN4215_c5_g1_i1.p1 TRINITY_DN4215_c5_g1~~TRINITY_DN4215_c5_g1_i1.p1  ORF type:complete len:1049 (+),score=431.97 TRINITY_DN4215_c5_g1_i1:43-3147(+)
MALPTQDVVVDCLRHVHTHPDAAVRQQAEGVLVGCQGVKGFAPLLVGVLLEETCELPQRQAAGLMLKKVLKENWEEQVDEADKAAVRRELPKALFLTQPKLTTAAGVALGVIAGCEYPEQWPSLIHDLVGVLGQAPPTPCVAAVVKCLRFIAEDLQSDVLAEFAAAAFPCLCGVLQTADLPEAVRRNAIAALDFTVTVATESCMTSDALPQSLKEGIPRAAEACVACIPQYDRPSLSVATLSFFNIVVACFPKALDAYLTPLAARLWDSLKTLAGMMHQKYAVFAEAAHADPVESGYTSDGDVINLERLILAHLQLVVNFLKKPTPRAAFFAALAGGRGDAEQLQVLKGFVVALLPVCSVTEESEEAFREAPSVYFQEEEEFEEGYLHSLRDTTCHVLELLIEGYKNVGLGAILDACRTVLTPFAAAPASLTPATWRPAEAALLALVSTVTCAASSSKRRRAVGVSAQQVLGVIAALLSAPNLPAACPFLTSRCLFGAFAVISKLNPDGAEVPPALLTTVVQCLHYDEAVHDVRGGSPVHHIPRLAALRAFFFVMKKLGRAEDATPPAVVAITKVLAKAAAANARAADNALQGDLLCGYLDDLGIVLSHHKTCPVGDLPRAAVELWCKFNENPFVIESVTDLFAALAQNGTSDASMREVVPYLARQVLGRPEAFPEGMIGSAVLILSHIVKTARPDLLRLAVTEAFPQLAALSEGYHATTSIAMCLRTIVTRCGGVALRDLALGNGRTALQVTFDILQHTLRNPDPMAEHGLGQTGKLCLRLFGGAGAELGTAGIAGLVTALVERLVVAQSATIVQELLFPLAALAVKSPEDLAALLAAGTPSPLVKVLQLWCDRVPDFFGPPQELQLLLSGLVALAVTAPVAQAEAAGGTLTAAPAASGKKAPAAAPVALSVAVFIAVSKLYLKACVNKRGDDDGDLRHMLLDDDDEDDDDEDGGGFGSDGEGDEDDDDMYSSESGGDYAVGTDVVYDLCGDAARVAAGAKAFLQGRMQQAGAAALPYFTTKEKAALQKDLMG